MLCIIDKREINIILVPECHWGRLFIKIKVLKFQMQTITFFKPREVPIVSDNACTTYFQFLAKVFYFNCTCTNPELFRLLSSGYDLESAPSSLNKSSVKKNPYLETRKFK